MKNFFLVENMDKLGTKEIANKIENYINSRGYICNQSEGYIKDNYMPPDTECIITLGGDGTMIKTAVDIAGKNIPIVGINLGRLGYLTSITKTDEIYSFLDRLIDENFSVEKRMMLEGYVVKKDVIKSDVKLALNEIVITGSRSVKTVRLKVYVNGDFLNEYSADGIIIATPTGSTAYNLSAGGPIVKPDASMIVVTPICPHVLTQRSIVLSEADIVEVEILDGMDTDVIVAWDGYNEIHICQGDHIIIKKSEITTSLIRLKQETFLDNLRNKMTQI